MSDDSPRGGDFDEEMAEYLQTFLDETEEQLDDLVETMLSLENASTNTDDLNEAFRLIHSIKGSAGMMGLDSITVLTHHLENRFERFRSGTEQLDEPTMNLVLRCIDFLRQCNERLREGQHLGSPAELLDELRRLEAQGEVATSEPEQPSPTEPAAELAEDSPAAPADAAASPVDDTDDGIVRMDVKFRSGLQLADLKAQLIVKRLAGLGDVKSTRPDLDSLSEADQLEGFEVLIETDEDLEHLRSAADVDGVESIEFPGGQVAQQPDAALEETWVEGESPTRPEPAPDKVFESEAAVAADEHLPRAAAHEPQPDTESITTDEHSPTEDEHSLTTDEHSPSEDEQTADVEVPAEAEPVAAAASQLESGVESSKPATKVAETMRVDIGRLDKLMNLTGELVVNRARFVQLSTQISPALRQTSSLNRIREFCDGLRNTLSSLDDQTEQDGGRRALFHQLRSGLDLIDEQSQIWEQERHRLEKFGEAVDQLSRVSSSLQKGVLDTRMVPVGPLFNRFKRVVRDLSKERGKQVDLAIRGEKTELDKRMIDELGDPLVHLVRNSIDHGLESPAQRRAEGKSETGTITLEASHSGNNVYVHVRDDGGGIDVAKIKARLADRNIVSESAIVELSDQQALDYIWHPGFSTATKVTDVSGRGVGMDVVRNRIRQLNGSIEVDSVPRQGTHFIIRLPLTLAIINCLLVRIRGVVFSMPIEDVREIVSVSQSDVINVQGKQTIDVRDEFIPLIRVDDLFRWHGIDYGHLGQQTESGSGDKPIDVVIMQSGGKAMGIPVAELLGSQDMVIKSLSDNFIDIRGLSGASILGDGSVCLMLDVGTVLLMATGPTATEAKELAT